MGQLAYEDANIVPPLVGFPSTAAPPIVIGMLNQVVFTATAAFQVVNLLDIFDCPDDGGDHFFTAGADGDKIYYALGNDALGEIDEVAVYAAGLADSPKFCYAIPDGQERNFNLKSAPGYTFLYFKRPVGAAGDAYLRVVRSSLRVSDTPVVSFRAVP